MTEKKYEEFDWVGEVDLNDIQRKDARDKFKRFICEKGNRIAQLRIVFPDIELDMSRESLERLNISAYKLILEYAKTHKLINNDSFLRSVASDIAIYIGEMVVSLDENLKWELHVTGGKKYIEYHNPSIRGFNVPNKNFSFAVTGDILTQFSAYVVKASDDIKYFVDLYDQIAGLCKK